jgi:antitoxin ParD1/3/4
MEQPPNAEKISITLPAEMMRVIRERVSAGSYGSTSEVIREALRGWMERERRLAALDAAIARGVADGDAGRMRDIDDVRKDMLERFAVKPSNPA